MKLYTLVRHSAWTRGKLPAFARAVEVSFLNSNEELQRVQRVGGLVFDKYTDAIYREMVENHPRGKQGLVPRVRGSFAALEVEGQPIYMPPGY